MEEKSAIERLEKILFDQMEPATKSSYSVGAIEKARKQLDAFPAEKKTKK